MNRVSPRPGDLNEVDYTLPQTPSPLQGLPFALQAYFPHPSATSGSDLAAGHGIYHFNLIDGHQSSPRDPPSLPLPPFDFSYSPLPENVRPLLYIPPQYVNSVT